jgi:hypothetical protein
MQPFRLRKILPACMRVKKDLKESQKGERGGLSAIVFEESTTQFIVYRL